MMLIPFINLRLTRRTYSVTRVINTQCSYLVLDAAIGEVIQVDLRAV